MQISEQNARQLVAFLPVLYNTLFNFTLPDTINQQNVLELDKFYGSIAHLTASVGNALGVDSTINLTRKTESFINNIEIPEPNDPAVKITRTTFQGVPVILHTPTEPSKEPRPALIFIHGGGWVYRDPYKYILQTTYLAKNLGAVVVSIDYRHPPEHPYPAPLDDCFSVTNYLMDNASKYSVNPNRIGIIGDSAGGTMSAAVSLRMRDEKKITLKTQVLMYPLTQLLDLNTPSYLANDQVPQLSKEFALQCALYYINVDASYQQAIANNKHICSDVKTSSYASFINFDAVPQKYRESFTKKESICDPKTAEIVKNKILNPYIFPLVAQSLSKLPPALVVTGEFDILRDDGLMYAARLKQSGVPVEQHLMEGGFHGMFDFLDRMKIGNQIMDIVVKYLQKNL